ncbi:MAG TPA: hypothetical protein VMM78_11530 [Thermomicrobiales bacterium]|nr:hypothetical protein [Thermomicrobiales bacterium]
MAPGEAAGDEREDAGGPSEARAATPERRAMTSDDFLVPGPSPESNEGLGRWGLSWLIFSLALIVMMALMSYICLVLARWTGLA